jgi:hypothetical protein
LLASIPLKIACSATAIVPSLIRKDGGAAAMFRKFAAEISSQKGMLQGEIKKAARRSVAHELPADLCRGLL